MKLWKNGTKTSTREEPLLTAPITDERALVALERSRRMPNEVVYNQLDGAINNLHRAIDGFHYQGLPPEEVETRLAEVHGMIMDLLGRSRA